MSVLHLCSYTAATRHAAERTRLVLCKPQDKNGPVVLTVTGAWCEIRGLWISRKQSL